MGKVFFRPISTVLLSCALIVLPAVIGNLGHLCAQDRSEAKVVSPSGYAGLSAKAQSRGKVRIIVGVNGTFTPEPALSHSEAQTQRAAISSAQNSVMSQLAAKGALPASTHKYKYVPYMAMTVDSATLKALTESSGVVSIEEDVPVRASDAESWNMALIGAGELHTADVTGTGMTVAVLDTGVDGTHPYLDGSVVSEACYSSNDPEYSATSLCPGGATDLTTTGSAMPYGGTCPAGECDHGTHVAGIAAGRSGVAGSPGPGVAPGANIIAIQVFSRFDSVTWCGTSSPCVMSFFSDEIKGLERVYELRETYTIASANMSLGGGEYSSQGTCDSENRSIKSAIDTLRKAGIATVISAGNDDLCGAMGAPGCISSAVSVGATTNLDTVASYSNSASFLKVFAPGSAITSSVPGTGYETWNGTSMAAPHVAGAWALAKQRRPTASVTDILKSFTSTGQNITDSKCDKVAKKRINVYQAYNYPSPTISVSPASLSFGSVKLGESSAAKSVTIKNTGPNGCSYLDVNNITASSGEFAFSPASCPPLAKGETCVLSVQITPASTYGSRAGSLVIESDASNKPSVTVKLSGNAVPPTLSAPKSVSLPSAENGLSSTKTIIVKNTGLSELTIGKISTPTSDRFALTNACDDATLNKGESCSVDIIFTPAAAKTTYQGSINVPSNDPKWPAPNYFTVTLKGTSK